MNGPLSSPETLNVGSDRIIVGDWIELTPRNGWYPGLPLAGEVTQFDGATMTVKFPQLSEVYLFRVDENCELATMLGESALPALVCEVGRVGQDVSRDPDLFRQLCMQPLKSLYRRQSFSFRSCCASGAGYPHQPDCPAGFGSLGKPVLEFAGFGSFPLRAGPTGPVVAFHCGHCGQLVQGHPKDHICPGDTETRWAPAGPEGDWLPAHCIAGDGGRKPGPKSYAPWLTIVFGKLLMGPQYVVLLLLGVFMMGLAAGMWLQTLAH